MAIYELPEIEECRHGLNPNDCMICEGELDKKEVEEDDGGETE